MISRQRADSGAGDLGDAVEDRVVERVALVRVGDRQPRDVVGRMVQAQLAVGELGHRTAWIWETSAPAT